MTAPPASLSPAPMSRRRFAGLAALAAAGVAGAWALRMPRTPAGERISVERAHTHALSGAMVLVDIRRPDEWRATGVPEGAQPVDMRRDDVITAILAAAGGDPSAAVGAFEEAHAAVRAAIDAARDGAAET